MNPLTISPGMIKGFPDGFEVSWAGANPYTEVGFCFGSEDGNVLFTDEAGNHVGQMLRASPSREAVNGVAAVGRHLAVSTRAEACLFKQVQSDLYRSVLATGSHGVIAGKGKTFLLPAGQAGGRLVAPDGEPPLTYGIKPQSKDSPLYMYRLVSLSATPRTESLVCASRTQGIGAVDFVMHGREQVMRTASFPGLDIVDVCPLQIAEMPRAFVAASRDGGLIFFRNSLADRQLQRVRVPVITGRIYRVMVCQRSLVILTSDALFVLHKAIDPFAAGDDLRRTKTLSFKMPIKAVDATLYGDDKILIVAADNKVVVASVPTGGEANYKSVVSQQDESYEELDPVWDEYAVETSSSLVASAN